MQTTMTLSANLNCSIFEIFDRDIDEVVMLINFYLELGAGANESDLNYENNKAAGHDDGFWDM